MSTQDTRAVLAKNWRALASGPFFPQSQISPSLLGLLPTDVFDLMKEFGGHEGFLGNTYLRLYRIDELESLNEAYDVRNALGDAVVFGSDGGGEAFAFLGGKAPVVRVPFIPLAVEHATKCGRSIHEFIQRLADSGVSDALDPKLVGLEIHQKHPIALGGSPADPANTVPVPSVAHAELCRFWNKTYRGLASEKRE